jgi:uncharacterized membrane protein
MNQVFAEKNLHRAFEVGLVFKAVFAVLEAVGGFVAFFIPQRFVLRLIVELTQQELAAANPNNVIAHFLIQTAQNFSISGQHFIGIYLATHGIVKLLVLAGLWRGKMWSYPLAIAVFAIFILYQLYRFTFTHSPWLLLLTLMDLTVVWLTWHEYRERKRQVHRTREAPAARSSPAD